MMIESDFNLLKKLLITKQKSKITKKEKERFKEIITQILNGKHLN